MNSSDILHLASEAISNLTEKVIDVVDIKKPDSLTYALNLSKVVSKLSPLIGNMIEFKTIDLLNTYDWNNLGGWERQDPGFPDATFGSDIALPNPGIEIKAWFPFATEITARFKESQKIFESNPFINVALIAWLPEHVIWGKPKIIDVLVVSGKSVAQARDRHYHRPPSYIVLEPEDTSHRTGNLQQTNTTGHKFQEDKSDIQEAGRVMRETGIAIDYNPDLVYQALIKQLKSRFVYREDTNYAKIDRIEHSEIEDFKKRVLSTQIQGKTVKEWCLLLSGKRSIGTLKEALYRIIESVDNCQSLDTIATSFTKSRPVTFEYDPTSYSLPLVAAESLPEYSSKSDAEVMLVGCYKNRPHLDWILNNHLYNIRLGQRNGSLEKSGLMIVASKLLLYDKENPSNYKVYELDTSKQILANSDIMIKNNYPGAKSSRNYILYFIGDEITNHPEYNVNDLREKNAPEIRNNGPFFVTL